MSGGSSAGETRSGVVPISSLLLPSGFSPNGRYIESGYRCSGAEGRRIHSANPVAAGCAAYQGGKAGLLAEQDEGFRGGVDRFIYQHPDASAKGTRLCRRFHGMGDGKHIGGQGTVRGIQPGSSGRVERGRKAEGEKASSR